jgi:Flp pilus assembly protein CpaB
MSTHTLKLLAWAALALGPSIALAHVANENQSAAGLTVELGIVPADTLRGRPEEEAVRKMHGGVPSGKSMYHVMVAVFDAKTGQRLTNVQVRARVEEVGLTSEEKSLESMRIADAVTYGNFFRMAGSGTFRITVQIRLPGTTRMTELRFEHRHP